MFEGDPNERIGKLLKYTLVEFIHRGRKPKVAEVDIVPSIWLTCGKNKKCVTKYMKSPMDEEDKILLQTLVQKLAPAPEDWPTFTVQIKGRADTYDKAVEKIERLKYESVVLTEDTDNDVQQIQKQLEMEVKRKNLLDKATKLKVMASSQPSSSQKNKNTNGSIKDSVPMQVQEDVGRVPKNASMTIDSDQGQSSSQDMIMESSSFDSECETSNHSQDTSAMSVNCNVEDDPLDLTPIPNAPEHLVPRSPTTDFYPDLGSQRSKSKSPSVQSPQPTEKVRSHTQNTSAGSPGVPEQGSTITQKAVTHANVLQLDLMPVMDLSNIECKSDFEVAVISSIAEIKADISHMKRRQDEMADFMIDKKVVKIDQAVTNFKQKYNITVPICTLEDFILFEDKLNTDKFFKNDVYIELKNHMDENYVITKSMSKMLKHFMKKNVAIRFTAVRTSRLKKEEKVLMFKGTTMYSLICGVIIYHRSKKNLETTEKQLQSAISDVICNVGNWEY